MLPFSQTPLKSTSVACSGLQFTDGTVSITEVILSSVLWPLIASHLLSSDENKPRLNSEYGSSLFSLFIVHLSSWKES